MRGFGNSKLWCHLSIKSGDKLSNKDIRLSSPLKVDTFRELVEVVAKIANYNPDYNLFFRGQTKDYKLDSGSSSFYPTIFRSPGRTLRVDELSDKFRLLKRYSEQLIEALEYHGIDNIKKLRKFPELSWSILQHYGVCETPLLDFTHSLRVAASFALNDAAESAYVFVFAFPYPNGTISYSTEDELLNVRLISACPSQALRPHFQEGYLLGTFPSVATRKQPSFDFGRRLIAKIELPKSGFWSEKFHAVPNDALYPVEDEVEKICNQLKGGVALNKTAQSDARTARGWP